MAQGPERSATTPETPGVRPADVLTGESAEDRAAAFKQLRELLLGSEQQELKELRERFDAQEVSIEDVARVLPEAIAERGHEDKQLSRALAPTIEASIGESVRRNPGPVADAIYPTLGPAIRKAVSEAISGFVETLNRAIEHSLSIRGLKWRLEAWRTGAPYGEIVLKHALVYRVDQAFLIHGKTGLLLAHAAVNEAEASDPDLVSGMLTAIRDFVSDSFDSEAGDEGLKTFSVGQRTVLVESGPDAMLAAVVRGQPPASFRGRVEETLETLHLHLHGLLDDFEGDTAGFEIAVPPLNDLLETVLTTDEPRSRSLAPRIAWVVAGVLVLAMIVLGVRSWLRWERALTLLEAQPGLVLLDADRDWNLWRLKGFGETWQIAGLRDPLAASPAVILEANRLSPQNLELRLETYLSLSTGMMTRRAEVRLEPPPEAQLSVTYNESGQAILKVSGTATPRWYDHVKEAGPGLPGIDAVDLDEMELYFHPEIQDLHDQLENQRVLFRIGSAELVEQSLADLQEAAGTLRRLQELADEHGWDVALHLVGRTDESGPEGLNNQLSVRRAEVVQRALEALGLVPDEVTFDGIAAEDPIAGSDPGERARLNRSTSFSVELTHERVRR